MLPPESGPPSASRPRGRSLAAPIGALLPLLWILTSAIPANAQRGTVIGHVIRPVADEESPVDDPFELVPDPNAITPPVVRDADVDAAIQAILAFPRLTYERRSSIGPGPVPGGGDGGPRAPAIHITSRGGIGGATMTLQAYEGAGLEGAVVVEPVRLDARAAARVERELRRSAGVPAILELDAYCLDMNKPAPPEGTVFRVAPPEVQRVHRRAAEVLGAARAARDRGLLRPDSDPEDYFHAVTQWAIWGERNALDAAAFEDEFLAKTREIVEAAGQAWTAEIEGSVRALVPNRWDDIRRILDLHGRAAGGGER